MNQMHNPARLDGESFDSYKARRAASQAAVKRKTLAGIGNQHTAPSSRQQLRDSQRSNGNLRGTYGHSLRMYFNRKMANASALRLAKKQSRRLEAA